MRENDLSKAKLQVRSSARSNRSPVENALQKLEWVACLFESEAEVFSVQDTEYNVVKISKGVERVFGKDVIGGKCYRVYQGRDSVCPDCPTEKLLTTGRAAFSSEQTGANGRTYAIWSLPLMNERGNIIAVLEHANDITERKRAETMLRASEEKYRAMIETSNDWIWVLDKYGNFTYFNKKAEKASGYDLDKWVGKSFGPIISPAHLERVKNIFTEVMNGKTVTYEVDVLKPDGSIITLSVNTVPSYSESEIVGTVSFGQDITERKRAEQTIRASEESFRNSLDTSSLGIRIVNAYGETLYANKALLDIYGYGSVDELRATPTSQRYTADSYVEHLVRKDRRRLGLPVADIYDISIVHKDGGVRQLRVHRGEVKWAGKTEHQAMYEDVTNEKRAQETLTALSHRLIKVQEEERHTIARELHDQIGQSLNVVNLLLQRATRPTETDVTTLINAAQEQVVELITRVSNLSLDLRPMMLDHLGLLDTFMWYLGRYTAITRVQVDFKHFGLGELIKPEVAITVYRVVQEALTNVARHAGVDRAAVNIWADRDRIYVRVEDKGSGFDPGAVDSTASSGISGMHERVSLMGGSLSIKSAPGTGALVSAEIPLGSARGDKKETA